jgi:Cu+-exporting ATPase
VAADGVVLGLIGCRDTPRQGAAAVVAELRALGIADIALLTGDRPAVASSLAAEVGIAVVHAEMLPDQKAAFLTSGAPAAGAGTVPLQVVGAPAPAWAMVGDGINDAPALAAASVGLAVGSGAELAAEAGDVVLMGDPLRPLPLLVALSGETVRVIRQNVVVFAIGVNLVGVVVTAWLLPVVAPRWAESSPLAAVLYHQVGSLAVLLNSMRLLAFGRTGPVSTVGTLRGWWRRADAWAGRWLDADEWLHAIGHHWKSVLAGSVGLGLAIYASSGFVTVNYDEVAVVRRFGSPVDPDLGPGLHWRWPWPVEMVTRVKPGQVRVVEVGFRSAGGGPRDEPRAALTWASGHTGEGIRRMTDESIMVTGDGALVELLASIRFRVSDPRRYLLEVNDPEAVVRAAAESVLRESAAGEPFLELLTVRRAEFQRLAEARLRRRLEEYDRRGSGPGVALEGLALHDLHPPQEVVSSFHDVARAMEAADRKANDALAEQLRKLNAARADAVQTERQAEARVSRVVAEAVVKRDHFLAWLDVRRRLPAPEEAALAAALAAGLADPSMLAASVQAYPARRAGHLAEHRSVTDFRLGWEALATALAGRDKVIVDSDTLPGRRQLLMFDPELFRPLLPVARSKDEGP